MSPGPRHNLRTRRRGLTLIELTIGLAMLGMILMASAGLMTATAAGWKGTETSFLFASLRDRAGARVEDVLTSARCVVQTVTPATAGQASSVFFWKTDGVTGTANGKAEFGEMALVEFDPATSAIYLYEAVPTATMTAPQLALATAYDWGDPKAATLPAYFKSQTWVSKTLLIGSPATGGAAVTAAAFACFSSSGSKPVLTYSLTLAANGLSTIRQGSATLRLYQVPLNLSL